MPFAAFNLVKLPDDVSDEQAIMISDIFPTGWMAADNAEIDPGDEIAVFGCGEAMMKNLTIKLGKLQPPPTSRTCSCSCAAAPSTPPRS